MNFNVFHERRIDTVELFSKLIQN